MIRPWYFFCGDGRWRVWRGLLGWWARQDGAGYATRFNTWQEAYEYAAGRDQELA